MKQNLKTLATLEENEPLSSLAPLKDEIGQFDYTQDIENLRSFTTFFCVMPYNLKYCHQLMLFNTQLYEMEERLRTGVASIVYQSTDADKQGWYDVELGALEDDRLDSLTFMKPFP